MKVLLLEDVASVGKAGEITDVADGYARNYLFPNSLAAAATEARIREAEAAKARAVKAAEEDLRRSQELAERINRKTVTVRAPTGPQGKLESAVTAQDIAAAVERELGAPLPEGAVRLSGPIHELGEQAVNLELPHGLEAEVTVLIEPEEETDHRP